MDAEALCERSQEGSAGALYLPAKLCTRKRGPKQKEVQSLRFETASLFVGIMGRRKFRYMALPRLGSSGSETSAWKNFTFDNSELHCDDLNLVRPNGQPTSTMTMAPRSCQCATNLDTVQPLAGSDRATSKFISLSRS